jgi:glycosyltransferase involved in cell wall biosynthesis
MATVLHVTMWYRESRGGIGTMIHTLVSGPSSHRHLVLLNTHRCPEPLSGADFSLYLPSLHDKSLSLRGIVSYMARGGLALWRLCRTIREQRVDCVHFHYPTGSSPLLALACRLTGTRLAVTFHGSDLVGIRELDASVRHWTIASLKRADRLVSVSDFIRHEAEELVPALGRHVTVHNGTNLRPASLTPAEAPLAPAGSDRYFLFIGTPREIKGADVLLKAWSAFRQTDSNARLVIIGGGWEGCELLNNSPALRDAHDVAIMGLRPHAEALQLISGAIALLLPSRREGLPYVMLEAGIFRTPVIAAAVGGIPEVITHEETGLLIDSGDATQLCVAMQTLDKDPALAKRLGDQLHSKVMMKFTHDSMRRGYDAIYSDLARVSL